MNFQIPNPYHHEEALEDIGFLKEDHQDRTTHQLLATSHDPQHRPITNEISPLRGSFFFTPNSPKHFRFEFHNNPDSNGITHKKGFQAPPSMASISKKINLEMQEENEQIADNSEFIDAQSRYIKRSPPNRSSKNAKGLRNLSQSVYRIVSQLNVTRYKEVADRLLSQICMENAYGPQGCKEEHNIKRRVYDALNVLIAAGILKKEGKQVTCNQPYNHKKTMRSVKHSRQLLEKQQLQQQLQKKAEALREQHQKLQKLEEKRKLIEYIIKRNAAERVNDEQILRFPLIGSMVATSEMHVDGYGKNTLSLRLAQQPFLYGDVDLLLRINKDTIETDKLLDNICKKEEEEEEM